MKENALVALLIIAVALSAWWAYGQAPSSEFKTDKASLNAVDRPITVADIAEIEVIQWPAYVEAPERFHAQIMDGSWVIPEMHNFPADLSKRLGPIIGSVINLTRGPAITSDSQRHADLRIYDPRSAQAINSHSYGQVICLKDINGEVLIDLVFGRYDQDLERSFVRHRGDDTVYTTTAFLYLEAHWSGWIQRKVLPVEVSDLSSVRIQGFADKPFQTKNTFTLNQQTQYWTHQGHTITKLAMKTYIEDLTELKIQQIFALDEALIQALGDTGFEWQQGYITGAPTQHSLTTASGATFDIYISKQMGERFLVYVSITADTAKNLSSNYRARLQNFVFAVDVQAVERLHKIPASFIGKP